MGVRKWHLARAAHHREVYDFLAGTHDDWALVALFYSAMQYVHSSLADEEHLPKDERHPRKHSGLEPGARGVNQLVAATYPEIYKQYMSLFDLSLRTRYDIAQLGDMVMPLAERQWREIKNHCTTLNNGRPWIPSQAK